METQNTQIKVRELRFGRPKTRKTASIVESYPTPMLVLNLEMDGLSVVKNRKVKTVTSDEYRAMLKLPPEHLPEVTAIDYIYSKQKKLNSGSSISYESTTFERFANDANLLFDSCPFKTVVLDSLTGLNEVAIGLIGAKNPAALKDARHWAGQAGAKIREVVSCLYALPCQAVVVIAHEQVTENETTKEVRVLPNMVSGVKEILGALASHYIYATTDGMDVKTGFPKPIVYTQPSGLVKGLGMRTGGNGKAICGPTFGEIYGNPS